MSSTAFDATDTTALERFFRDLPNPVDHVMVTAGRPYCARLADIDFGEARRAVDADLLLPLHIARNATSKVRAGGTLLFMSGTGSRRPAFGLGVASALTAAQAKEDNTSSIGRATKNRTCCQSMDRYLRLIDSRCTLLA